MLCDDVVMLCGDFMLFLDIDDGQTGGQTDICTSRVAFATEKGKTRWKSSESSSREIEQSMS